MNGIQIATAIILGVTLCLQAYTIIQMVKTSRIRKRTEALRLDRLRNRMESAGGRDA